jgi:DNA ligase 1
VRLFAQLMEELDRSNATLDKSTALVRYFRQAPAADAAYAVYFLLGERLAKIASSDELRRWAADASQTPLWLVEASYAEVGDLAETITLLVDQSVRDAPAHSLSDLVNQLTQLVGLTETERQHAIVSIWQQCQDRERWVVNKLLTGGLRIGVSKALVQQALSELSGIERARIAQRMMGKFKPSAATFTALIDPSAPDTASDLPYPFYLASPIEEAELTLIASNEMPSLGSASDWQIECKWDGIRLQLIRRSGKVVLYSRGEERLDGRFPEIEFAAMALPDGCVLDGELLVWHEDKGFPEGFSQLQTRIQRKKPSAKIQAQTPVAMMAYDLLELNGKDLRSQALDARQALLADLLKAKPVQFRFSAPILIKDWSQLEIEREKARAQNAEGVMIKRKDSIYQSGRKRGDWWKHKLAPMTIDAVLTYSAAGHGRRAGLHSDHTFALWHDGHLVTIAKAYSGLSDQEMTELDKWIRANTVDRFGPVRQVQPQHVFELAFEAVQLSSRHKSGVAVRFPRIVHWRRDKDLSQANHLADLLALAK